MSKKGVTARSTKNAKDKAAADDDKKKKELEYLKSAFFKELKSHLTPTERLNGWLPKEDIVKYAKSFKVAKKDGKEGCEVKYFDECAEFKLLSTNDSSYDKLSKSVAAYMVAYEKYRKHNHTHLDKDTEISFKLNVDNTKELKPALKALTGVCKISEFYLNQDGDKAPKKISATLIAKIQKEIDDEKKNNNKKPAVTLTSTRKRKHA